MMYSGDEDYGDDITSGLKLPTDDDMPCEICGRLTCAGDCECDDRNEED